MADYAALPAVRTRKSGPHLAERPRQCFVATEHHDVAAIDRDRGRHRRRPPLEFDRAGIDRQTVEIRAVERSEFLQPVKRALLVEHLRVGLQRSGADEDAGTTAGGLLEAREMRCR